MLFRYATAATFGTLATFGLLMLMRSVIADPMPALESPVKGEVVDIVRLLKDQEPVTIDREPKPPPPPDEPPPNPPPPIIGEVGRGIEIRRPEPPEPRITGGFELQGMDGNYLPLVRVAPVYPRRALERNVEGYVIVEFVVTKLGTVRDPVVIEANPAGYFERSAIDAALKFKYKPRRFGGEYFEVPGVRNRFVFEISDE